MAIRPKDRTRGSGEAGIEKPLARLSNWVSTLAGAGGMVLAFFFLVGFHYARAILDPYQVTDGVERSVSFMASVGAERAIEFCEQNWLTLALLAIGAYCLLAFSPLLLRRFGPRSVRIWERIPPTAGLFAKVVFSLVLVFFIFGWLPLNVAGVQARINVAKFDYLFSECAMGRGNCEIYRTPNESIRGIRLTGDRDRVFVIVGPRQTRVLPITQIISVSVGHAQPSAPAPGG